MDLSARHIEILLSGGCIDCDNNGLFGYIACSCCCDSSTARPCQCQIKYRAQAEISVSIINEGCDQHEQHGIVLVPDMNAAALTALAKKQGQLTYLNGDYEKWDYLVGFDKKTISGRGRKFEVLTWKPDRNVTSDEVRKYFREKGFYGHTAAFITWAAQHHPEGYHASIPEDNACWRDSGGHLCTPYSYFGDGSRQLCHRWVEFDWRNDLCDQCFVAFREL